MLHNLLDVDGVFVIIKTIKTPKKCGPNFDWLLTTINLLKDFSHSHL